MSGDAVFWIIMSCVACILMLAALLGAGHVEKRIRHRRQQERILRAKSPATLLKELDAAVDEVIAAKRKSLKSEIGAWERSFMGALPAGDPWGDVWRIEEDAEFEGRWPRHRVRKAARLAFDALSWGSRDYQSERIREHRDEIERMLR